MTNDDLPEPDTPVTTVRHPSGTLTLIFEIVVGESNIEPLWGLRCLDGSGLEVPMQVSACQGLLFNDCFAACPITGPPCSPAPRDR